MPTTDLLNEDGEVVVQLAGGWTLRSGVYDKDAPGARTSGEYVRICTPEGGEYAYWDQAEWRADPALVMGAIINSAAGLRLDILTPPAELDRRHIYVDGSGNEWLVDPRTDIDIRLKDLSPGEADAFRRIFGEQG